MSRRSGQAFFFLDSATLPRLLAIEHPFVANYTQLRLRAVTTVYGSPGQTRQAPCAPSIPYLYSYDEEAVALAVGGGY